MSNGSPPTTIEGWPPLETGKIAVAPNGGIWRYQPNVPSGIIEIVPGTDPPVNTALPVVTVIAPPLVVGGAIAANAGTWTGSPTYTRQWLRSGEPIAGATATSYIATVDDVGHLISCVVTGTNSAGSASAVSNAVGPVANGARAAANHGKTAHHARSLHR